MASIPWRWVDSADELQAFLNANSAADCWAVDTEFMRTDTYYPKPALIQLSAGSEIALIDPVALFTGEGFTGEGFNGEASDGEGLDSEASEALAALLADPDVTKLMHSVSEDYEVFRRFPGVIPQQVLDTQLGAGLAGLAAAPGYQNLVEQLLGIHVPKGETRSNWLQRPLSEAQCEYAALDVLYLAPLHKALSERLSELGRLDWWVEDSRLAAEVAARDSVEQSFDRCKGAARLNARQQGALKALCEWREREAIKRNIPRTWVLKDGQCVDIAKRLVSSLSALSDIRDIKGRFLNQYGKTVIELVAGSEVLPDTECQWEPTGDIKTCLKQWQQWVRQRAEAMGIEPEVLARKKDLEALLAHREKGTALPLKLQGWRRHELVEPLLAL